MHKLNIVGGKPLRKEGLTGKGLGVCVEGEGGRGLEKKGEKGVGRAGKGGQRGTSL